VRASSNSTKQVPCIHVDVNIASTVDWSTDTGGSGCQCVDNADGTAHNRAKHDRGRLGALQRG
jgi:hypothetical protein